jgi:hypothetical protein
MYRDPNTKVLATRKEVTELVHALINQEIEDGRDEPTPEREESEPVVIPTRKAPVELDYEARAGTQGMLLPDRVDLQRACERVLAHIEENASTDSVNVGWCVSILAATGAV